MTIAVDLDGCLAQAQEPYDELTIGEPVPEAVLAIRIWLAAGHRVILHTCRAQRGKYLDDAWDQGQRIRLIGQWLASHYLGGVTIWVEQGKPDADLYLDDRAQRVTADAASWAQAEAAVATRAREGAL